MQLRLMVDMFILQTLRAAGVSGPSQVSEFTGMNRAYVNDRMRELINYGLIKKETRGSYMLTKEGYEYMAGEGAQYIDEDFEEKLREYYPYEPKWVDYE